MVVVKSLPDGARVYLDGVLASATNATLGSLKPGSHNLRAEKDGFAGWEKEILVAEELVTSVDIVLVPLGLEIKPLTVSGVASPTQSSFKDKIYYLSKNQIEGGKKTRSGIHALPIAGSLLNLFKSGTNLILPDSPEISFSSAESIEASPSDNQLLVKMNQRGYYLVDLNNLQGSLEATQSAEAIYKSWALEETGKKTLLAERFDLKDDWKRLATDRETAWSPDEKKFLYRAPNTKGDSIEYRVRDLTDPLGVGVKDNYLVMTVAKDSPTKVIWYPDSRHLISSECVKEKSDTKYCPHGSIHLIETDGRNNTQIYTGYLASAEVFPTADGAKIIILTTFNQASPANLYAISLR